jgi:PhnB protein
MPSVLNPYFGFAGNAREAMEFYRDVFGGSLDISTYGDFGQGDTPLADLVMHSLLKTPAGFTIMGSDSPEGRDAVTHSSVSVSLSGDDEVELRGYWDMLSVGATITVPLERQMWGDTFGMCVDRFGTNWMVNIAGPAT